MTRYEAGELVAALDDYMGHCIRHGRITAHHPVGSQIERDSWRKMNATRERLIDRLSNTERTDPLAGNAR